MFFLALGVLISAVGLINACCTNVFLFFFVFEKIIKKLMTMIDVLSVWSILCGVVVVRQFNRLFESEISSLTLTIFSTTMMLLFF